MKTKMLTQTLYAFLLPCIFLLPVQANLDKWLAEERQNMEKKRGPASYSIAAQNLLDIPYLPDRDYPTPTSNGHEYRTRMNVYIPKGEGPFPAILLVHGGAYIMGSKDPRPNHWGFNGRLKMDAIEQGLKRGYVMVGVNYPLGKGIHPQVQRDFKELVRHLRKHAGTYRIDPLRIGGWGSSAGGWLLGSAGLTTADHYGRESKISATRLRDFFAEGAAQKQRLNRLKSVAKKEGGRWQMAPFDELSPRHPKISSRMNAIAFDFVQQLEHASKEDPRMSTVTGKGMKGKFNPKALRKDYPRKWFDVIELSEARTEGKGGWHLPAIAQPVKSLDGTREVSLMERVFEFFDHSLKGPAAKTPAAELRPNQRMFAEGVTVSFAVPHPSAQVYYTLDGSEPTLESPLFTAPFELTSTSQIRFLTVVKGMQPSGIGEGSFIQTTPPPNITGPEVLPVAKVGTPYSVQFEAEGASEFELAAAHFINNKDKAMKQAVQEKGHAWTFGLVFDRATGRLQGTPTAPGNYLIEIMAAESFGKPSSSRVYRLQIQP